MSQKREKDIICDIKRLGYISQQGLQTKATFSAFLF